MINNLKNKSKEQKTREKEEVDLFKFDKEKFYKDSYTFGIAIILFTLAIDLFNISSLLTVFVFIIISLTFGYILGMPLYRFLHRKRRKENKIKKKQKIKKKTPISIILILAWMFITIISLILKYFRGMVLTKFGYYVDFIILFGFIIFIILFLYRIKNTWKYFISFIVLLMVEKLFMLIFVVVVSEEIFQIIKTLGFISPKTFMLNLGFKTLLQVILYLIVIYFTYKNRKYFDEK